MKRFKGFIFLFISIFVLPLFCFACDEITFDSIAYVLVDVEPSEIVENVNYARSQTILSEIKMDLKTDISFKFFATSDRTFSSTTIKKEISSQIGKDKDSLLFSKNEKKYIDGNLKTDVEDIYEKKTDNYQVSAYQYEIEKFYNANGQETVKYSRQEFDYLSTTTLTNFYSDIINIINYDEVDEVYKKSYEGVDYYKLVADVDGANTIKQKFAVNENLKNSPELFQKANNLDYIKSFSCEFGLKDASGTVYITYFKMDYTVTNTRFEKYLEVSAKTTLENYGESVVIKDVEDRNLHTACTFVDQMNSDGGLLRYKLPGSNGTEYLVKKIKRGGSFDYSAKIGNKNYYVVKNEQENSSHIYEIVSAQDKTYKEITNETDKPDFKFDLIDFSLSFHSKVNENSTTAYENTEPNFSYQFGGENNYIKVYFENDKILKIESNVQNPNIIINIESYGIDDGSSGLVSSIEGYEFQN